MSEPTFSVIITTRDRPGLLAEALRSVVAQDFKDFECLVVDDASREPVSVVDDPRVHVIRRTRSGGYPAALNEGLGAAGGRYVCFLDDDDLFTRDRLTIAIEGLERAPAAICWRANPESGIAGRNRLLEGDVHDSILERSPPVLGQTALERSAAPRFDERLVAAADVEWWIRATKGTRFTTVPRVGLLLRRHPGPRNSKNLEHRLRSRLLILEKHRDYFEQRPAVAARFWRRTGLLAQRLGHHSVARAALWRSLALQPGPKTAAHLARSLRPSGSREEGEPAAERP